jgi:transposase
MAKHSELEIADDSVFIIARNQQIATEAALDGLCVIRSTAQHPTLTTQGTVRAYKQLKMAEHAFQTINDTLQIRLIRHHLETRVRAHAFLCTLAYYISFELRQRLTPCRRSVSYPTH